MSVVFAGLTPHPPLLIPEIGHNERDKVTLTDQAMKKLAGSLVHSDPDVVVFITPHGPVSSDGIMGFNTPSLEGNMAQFNAPQVSLNKEVDQELLKVIADKARDTDVLVGLLDEKECQNYNIRPELDHGVIVPLYYFEEFGLECPIVVLGMGLLPYEELYHFGQKIAEAGEELGRDIAVIASGDLSHRLTPSAPAGYNPHGKEFDKKIVKALKKKNIEKIMDFDRKLVEKAGECGLRPIIMMLGSLDGLEVDEEVISYEGPFGVGYCVATFQPTGKKVSSKIEDLYTKRSNKLEGQRAGESPLVKLARNAITNYANDEQVDAPDELTPKMKERAGAFVSIKKHGKLRGCIGTTQPTQKNLAQEITKNAIQAAFYDPRFFPIEEEEIDDLSISVDVLGEPEPVDCMSKLDPDKYGVIVKQGQRTGLLLPDLDGVETVEQQVNIAKQKAGIVSDEDIELYRFEVKRYT